MGNPQSATVMRWLLIYRVFRSTIPVYLPFSLLDTVPIGVEDTAATSLMEYLARRANSSTISILASE